MERCNANANGISRAIVGDKNTVNILKLECVRFLLQFNPIHTGAEL